MKASRRRIDDALLFALRGEFDMFVCRSFREEMERELEAGARYVALNLARVVFLGSSAVSALLHLRNRLDAEGGVLVLSEPSIVVREVLEQLGLQAQLPWEADDEAALEALAAAA